MGLAFTLLVCIARLVIRPLALPYHRPTGSLLPPLRQHCRHSSHCTPARLPLAAVQRKGNQECPQRHITKIRSEASAARQLTIMARSTKRVVQRQIQPLSKSASAVRRHIIPFTLLRCRAKSRMRTTTRRVHRRAQFRPPNSLRR